MKEKYAEFRQLGGDIVAISFAQPAAIAAYLAQNPMPFPVLSDRSRASYQAFGLQRTSWGTLLRPAVLGRYLRLMFHGWRPRRPDEGEDVWQLGGDFVIDSRCRLVYAHASMEPTDRPPVSELLEAVRTAASSGTES